MCKDVANHHLLRDNSNAAVMDHNLALNVNGNIIAKSDTFSTRIVNLHLD